MRQRIRLPAYGACSIDSRTNIAGVYSRRLRLGERCHHDRSRTTGSTLLVQTLSIKTGQKAHPIVSRPLLLHGVGKLTTHAAQKTLTITSTHGRAYHVRAPYQRVCQFFDELKAIAPQLTPLACWYRILSEALKKYLNGMILKPPEQPGYG